MENRPEVNRPKDLGEGAEVPFPVVHSGNKIEVSETINFPPETVYSFWRNLTNHTYFIQNLEGVEILDEKRSRWRWNVKPFGIEAERTSEIIADIPGKMLSWQTLPGSSINQAGSVWFKPVGNNQTSVHWLNAWDPPAGELGNVFAKILGEDPAHTMREDLDRLKKVLEHSSFMNRNENPSLA